MTNKLFVANLPYSTTVDELRDHFAPHGTVMDVAIICDKETGRSRGYGFVTMSTPEEAMHAIDALNTVSFGGRNLTVREAQDRQQEPRNPNRPGR